MRCTRCITLYAILALVVALLGFTAGAEAATQNTITWQDNSNNEQRFNLERKAVPCADTSLPFVEISTPATNATTYVDTAVTEGVTYCYRVAASNTAGKSGYSNTGERLVPFSVPAAPSVLGVGP